MPHVRGHRLGGIGGENRPQFLGQLGLPGSALGGVTRRKQPTGATRRATRGGGGGRRPEKGLTGGFDFSQLSRRGDFNFNLAPGFQGQFRTGPGQRLGLTGPAGNVTRLAPNTFSQFAFPNIATPLSGRTPQQNFSPQLNLQNLRTLLGGGSLEVDPGFGLLGIRG